MRRADWSTVAGLTAAALGLRLAGASQTLDPDELYTYANVVGRPLRDVLGADDQNNPPLFYVLAWASAKLGDPARSIRLPSVALGAATVPIVYALGLRAVGRWAATVGAAVMTLTPFAAYYGVEARAYASLMFFVALSTLALLLGLDEHRRRWWALFVVASCGVVYTHYLGAAVLAVQGAWALAAHPTSRRALLAAHAAAVVGCLPLAPAVLGERGLLLPDRPLTPEVVAGESVRLFPGHPRVALDEVPGIAALIALVAAVLAAAAAAVIGARRRGEVLRAPSSRVVLLGLLAVTGTLGFVAYTLASPTIFISRYLSPALPALALLLGALLALPSRRVSLAATAIVVAVLLVGAVRTLAPEHRRPDYAGAVRFVNDEAGVGDVVVDAELRYALSEAFLYGKQAVPRRTYSDLQLDPRLLRANRLEDAVRATAPGGRIFVLTRTDAPPAEGGPSLRLETRRAFAGIKGLQVRVFAVAESPESTPAGGRGQLDAIRRCLSRHGRRPAFAASPSGALGLRFVLSEGGSGLILVLPSPSAARRVENGVRPLALRHDGDVQRRGTTVIAYLEAPSATDRRLAETCL